MKKILVPTDFSPNSKSAIRFAIHLAFRQKIELVFVHVVYIMRASHWSDAYYEKYRNAQMEECVTKFEKFIADIYRQKEIKPGKFSTIVIEDISADIAILDYCRKNPGIDYICISTRGAGKFKKIFGTHTGNLITKSAIPVIAIPKNYRVVDLKTVLYATDLRNYEDEIKRVIDFAQPLKAKIDVVHFAWPDEILFDKKVIEVALKKEFKYGLKVYIEKNDGINSLIENLEKEIRIKKPSVVIMFTNQQRTFFQKLFLSSKAEELSFKVKVPLLVFNKI